MDIAGQRTQPPRMLVSTPKWEVWAPPRSCGDTTLYMSRFKAHVKSSIPISLVVKLQALRRNTALLQKGVVSLSAPHDFLQSLRVAWVADPEGNPIQIVAHRAQNNESNGSISPRDA
jgi:hypothetical protein